MIMDSKVTGSSLQRPDGRSVCGTGSRRRLSQNPCSDVVCGAAQADAYGCQALVRLSSSIWVHWRECRAGGSAREADLGAGDKYGENLFEAGDVIEWVTRHSDDVGVLSGLDGALLVPEAADFGGH